jgi:hypothetical protein
MAVMGHLTCCRQMSKVCRLRSRPQPPLPAQWKWKITATSIPGPYSVSDVQAGRQLINEPAEPTVDRKGNVMGSRHRYRWTDFTIVGSSPQARYNADRRRIARLRAGYKADQARKERIRTGRETPADKRHAAFGAVIVSAFCVWAAIWSFGQGWAGQGIALLLFAVLLWVAVLHKTAKAGKTKPAQPPSPPAAPEVPPASPENPVHQMGDEELYGHLKRIRDGEGVYSPRLAITLYEEGKRRIADGRWSEGDLQSVL